MPLWTSFLDVDGPKTNPAGLEAARLWFRLERLPDHREAHYGPEGRRDIEAAVREGVSAALVERTRRKCPYLTVVFCDRNTESEIPLGADLSFFEGLHKVKLEESRALAFGKKSTALCGIASLDLMDTFGLSQGLRQVVPPAVYLYLARSTPIEGEGVAASLRKSATLEVLEKQLLAGGGILLRLGPDSDYLELISPNSGVLSEILSSR